MHHRPNEKKTVIPAPRIRGGKLRRESTAYRRGTKSAINYVHLLNLSIRRKKFLQVVFSELVINKSSHYFFRHDNDIRQECSHTGSIPPTPLKKGGF